MILRSPLSAFLILSMGPLLACKPPVVVADNQNSTVHSQTSAEQGAVRNMDIGFAFFRRSHVRLFMDGREIFNGPRDMISESNGAAGSIKVPMENGPHTFRLVSGAVDTTVRVEVTPRTQIIFVNPVRPPFIEAMDHSPGLD